MGLYSKTQKKTALKAQNSQYVHIPNLLKLINVVQESKLYNWVRTQKPLGGVQSVRSNELNSNVRQFEYH